MNTIKSIIFFVILITPSIVMADTGSTELSPVLKFLQDNMNGMIGKIIVISSILVAVINAVIKFNGYLVGGCLATALFTFYGDDVLLGMFSFII